VSFDDESIVNASIMISPVMDTTGVISGFASAGSVSKIAASFSATL
jgi:hypothetical protein